MAIFSLGGREFTLAPYKIADLRKAAPFLDRLGDAVDTVGGLADSASDMLGVISVGLVKQDPTLTLENLEEQIGFSDLPAIRDCLAAIMQEAGMQKASATGEAQASPEVTLEEPAPTAEASPSA